MRRAFRVVAILAVTVAVGIGIVVATGVWYHSTRFSQCESAMGPLVASRGTRAEVAGAIGGHIYASYSQPRVEDLIRLARGWNQKVAFIQAQASVSQSTDVVLVRDMVYFVFYDEARRARSFACVGN